MRNLIIASFLALSALPAAAQMPPMPWPIMPPEFSDACGGRAPCDLGGPATVGQLLTTPQRISNNGLCVSRCAFELVLNRHSCVDPGALIGFHAASDLAGWISPEISGGLVGSIPYPKVRRLLMRTGWAFREKVTYLSGADLNGLGLRRCQP